VVRGWGRGVREKQEEEKKGELDEENRPQPGHDISSWKAYAGSTSSVDSLGERENNK